MDLKKRLASLDRLTRKPETSRLPAERGVHGISPQAIATSSLGLQELPTPWGACYYRDYLEDISAPAGPLPDLQGFLSQPGEDALDAEDVLFLDTETTGLAGGTGTIAFLVGLGWWQGSRFVVRQYFLCGPGGENALLNQVHELVRGFKAVATFNGASFDLPLLKTRALLNRLEHPWDDTLSWDLLVPARRLWGRRLANCRQQTVEKSIADLERDDRDIEGHLIPQTWFDFLQLGQSAGLVRVLYHNQRDMVGMARIFERIIVLRRALVGEPKDADWQDAWALGRIAERRGEGPQALSWMRVAQRAAETHYPAAFGDPRFVGDVLRVLKRGGEWSLVENVIAHALDCGQNDWWLQREAAILYEHRLVDLARATRHALAAGDEHRLLRLKRKQKLEKLRQNAEDLIEQDDQG